jgi:hypothetical protein
MSASEQITDSATQTETVSFRLSAESVAMFKFPTGLRKPKIFDKRT